MEYGFSILMAAFSAALLLYAGLMVLFKPDLMTVPRRTIDYKIIVSFFPCFAESF